MKKIKFEESSGNVFADIGLPKNMLQKAELCDEIREEFFRLNYTIGEACRYLGFKLTVNQLKQILKDLKKFER